jgi:hypothetical protein
LSAIVNSLTTRNARHDIPAGDSKAPWDKIKENVLVAIKNGTYYDPVICDNQSKMHLQFKSPFSGEELNVSKEGFVFAKTSNRLPDVSSIFDPARVYGGYEQGITWAAAAYDTHQISPDTVAKMLQLLSKVKNWPGVSELSKSTYFKHFLHRHAGSPDLLAAQSADTELIFKFLQPMRLYELPPTPGPVPIPPLGGRGRGLKRSAPSAPPAQRAAPQMGRTFVGGVAGSGRTPSAKLCKSRVDLGFICSYPDCIFSHSCATCGKDHPASACQVWDAAKGAAAAALIKRRG